MPTLFSDGYEGYEPSILEAFGRRYTAPKTGSVGRPRLDIIRWPQGLAYGQVIKSAKEQARDGIHLKVLVFPFREFRQDSCGFAPKCS